MHSVPSITVEELKKEQDRGEKVTLVDVREPHEWAISEFPGSVKIPLGALPQRFRELSSDANLVVYCRSGSRSAQAVQFLLASGFAKARNLTGGINRWAESIDPSMRKY
jgi:sulfur-carrier protein adenylyltransferase/sulfurtransferase